MAISIVLLKYSLKIALFVWSGAEVIFLYLLKDICKYDLIVQHAFSFFLRAIVTVFLVKYFVFKESLPSAACTRGDGNNFASWQTANTLLAMVNARRLE